MIRGDLMNCMGPVLSVYILISCAKADLQNGLFTRLLQSKGPTLQIFVNVIDSIFVEFSLDSKILGLVPVFTRILIKIQIPDFEIRLASVQRNTKVTIFQRLWLFFRACNQVFVNYFYNTTGNSIFQNKCKIFQKMTKCKSKKVQTLLGGM